MSDTTSPSGYTDYERELLGTYFSVVDGPEHADIYLVHNLPAEVAATLNGVYSRSSKSMRDQFLDRLRQGLESQGKQLEDLPLPSANKDELSAVMADKSGKFLKTYAIDHGHNSLREGSVVHLAIEGLAFGTVAWPTHACLAGVARELYTLHPGIKIGFEEMTTYDDSKSGSLVVAVDARSSSRMTLSIDRGFLESAFSHEPPHISDRQKTLSSSCCSSNEARSASSISCLRGATREPKLERAPGLVSPT